MFPRASRIVVVLLLCSCLPLSSRTDVPSPPTVQRPAKVDRYLQQYRYLAFQLYEERRIPLAVTFAVAGIETDWGQSHLANASNNHFGIKSHDWRGPVFCTFTTEWQDDGGFLPVKACFRKYPLISASYRDFGRFIAARPGYRPAFHLSRWDYRGWTSQIQRAGYATDPFYARKLLRVIEEYQLYRLDQE